MAEEKHKNLDKLPTHVGIIMDGNGRWAESKVLPRLAGHRAGADNLPRVARAFGAQGIPYLTVYAFSTENWSRPQLEVQGLMELLRETLSRPDFLESLHKENIRLSHIGRLDRLTADLRKAISNVLERTKDNTGLTLTVAFDYGGREELLQAYRAMMQEGIPTEGVNEETLRRYLYTADLPDPDLIIRTGGEERLSNFLLWQSAYSEYYTTPCYWPDFDEAEVKKALQAYSQRQRRFGGLRVPG